MRPVLVSRLPPFSLDRAFRARGGGGGGGVFDEEQDRLVCALHRRAHQRRSGPVALCAV